MRYIREPDAQEVIEFNAHGLGVHARLKNVATVVCLTTALEYAKEVIRDTIHCRFSAVLLHDIDELVAGRSVSQCQTEA